MTSLSVVYRITQDQDVAAYMKASMDAAYSKLTDTDGDSYRNYLYYNGFKTMIDCQTMENAEYCGTDLIVLDEILAHASLAAAAVTLRNAGYDIRPWINYLKNDFEAKWRARNAVSTGFPFMFMLTNVTHGYINLIRYHYNMYLLTGDYGYYQEAQRLAANVRHEFTVNELGQANWGHFIVEDLSAIPGGCQPGVYVRTTVQGILDLNMQDPTLFPDAMLPPIAKTMAEIVLAASPDGSAVYSSCGNAVYASNDPLANFPYGTLGAWDGSGITLSKQLLAYNRSVALKARTQNAPATMIAILNLH